MNTATRDYPASDLRVSGADRDRAVRELTEAFQVGRITIAEFDQRCEQVLGARTGKELTALLADLPYDRGSGDTAELRRVHRVVAAWIVVGASAAAAISLAAVPVATGGDLVQRAAARGSVRRKRKGLMMLAPRVHYWQDRSR